MRFKVVAQKKAVQAGEEIEGKDHAPDEADSKAQDVARGPEAQEIPQAVGGQGPGRQHKGPNARQARLAQAPEKWQDQQAGQESDIDACASTADRQWKSPEVEGPGRDLMACRREDRVDQGVQTGPAAPQVRGHDDGPQPDEGSGHGQAVYEPGLCFYLHGHAV